MSIQNTLKFPSGRNLKRLKQDAKALAKSRNISLHLALDEVARINGGTGNWSQSVAALQNAGRKQKTKAVSPPQSILAQELGITDDDLKLLTWETQENSSDDGLVYGFILTFDEDNPPEILGKIERLSEDLTIRVSTNAFDEPANPYEQELESYPPVRTNMNPYRKLLVLGLNEILEQGLLSLEWDGKSHEETAHIETSIAGHNTIITWTGIGHGEIRLSIWWKYDHSKHPQANLTGNSRESFSGSRPLAKRLHYPKFVGVVCSTWLERKDGKYLQGEGNRSIFECYTRKGELQFLKNMPNPQPLGYAPEGRFHM